MRGPHRIKTVSVSQEGMFQKVSCRIQHLDQKSLESLKNSSTPTGKSKIYQDRIWQTRENYKHNWLKTLNFFFSFHHLFTLSLPFSYPNTPINQPLKIQGQRGSELRGKKHERTDSVLLPILSLSRGVKLCRQRREALTDEKIEVLIETGPGFF